MNRIVRVLSAFAAGALAAAAVAQERLEITPALVAAAEKEGELTLLYSSPLVSMQGITDDFRKAYPKIKVNLERKAGSAGAQALMQEAAAGVARIDVFQGSDVAANQELVDLKLFAPLVPAGIDGYLPSARIMEPFLYYPEVNSTVIMYNPRLVTDDEVRRLRAWNGILDPAFKGRISVVEPTFGVTLAPLLYVMNTPGLGADFLRRLRSQDPHVYTNTAQAREAVISGQRPISWGAQWEAVVLSEIEKGTPVRFVYPDVRVEWGGTGYGVLAKAPRPNAARLFMAWKFSKAGAASEQAPHTSSRPALKQLEDVRAVMNAVRKEPWFSMSETVWNPDPKDWVRNGPAHQQTWTQIMRAPRR